jgi:hypothetical protein
MPPLNPCAGLDSSIAGARTDCGFDAVIPSNCLRIHAHAGIEHWQRMHGVAN